MLMLAAQAVPPGASLSAGYPAYARQGANALYSEFGGFVPFFGGVFGNVSFTVMAVFSNGTMEIIVQANVSQSGEGPPQFLNTSFLDSVYSPTQFPALPAENLSEASFVFEHTSVHFIKEAVVSVPAGNFNTTEYSGTSPDGNLTYYWFDRPTGLIVEVSKAGAAIQLRSSNVALPIGSPSALEAYLPYIALIAVLWGGIGAAYLILIRHNIKTTREGSTEGRAPKGQRDHHRL
jgi:hypothetical protein